MLSLLLSSLFAFADDGVEWDVGVEGGWQQSLNEDAVGTSPSISVHATWQFADVWGIELKAGRTEAHVADPADGDIEAFDPRLELQYYFQDRSERVRPFLGLAGGMYAYWERNTVLADAPLGERPIVVDDGERILEGLEFTVRNQAVRADKNCATGPSAGIASVLAALALAFTRRRRN